MKIEEVKSYEIVEKKELKDLGSAGYLLKHKKTGAKVVLISNDDDNKVFYIGFRTPPRDSTGVAHILEHSVLCGSRDFPIKDPFVELVKGSLNTFLNAMTYPDKTLYPVASCNDMDFQNLMHVYLDAVFYPNIYRNPSIFRQEGWHYEMENEEDELKINGVVYNEMKGAYSSPDDVLEREIMNSLYPDTEYGVESGGDPDAIPSLTYEEFLQFHKSYYHPSNSYIYLYGNMDMAEKLRYIDENYLSAFEYQEINSNIHLQKAFEETRRIVKEYPVDDGENEGDGTYLSLNVSFADSLDRDLYVAMDILDYALCSAPGAVLKQALIDKGIGKDVYSVLEMGIKQPYFSVVAKDTTQDREQEFLDTIYDTLRKVAEEGLDEKALLAGLNYFEFKYREADFGSYPKGLMYGLQMMDSWLYDESRPFIHIEANETFQKLRALAKDGYFEQLIEKYLLDNKHKSVVILTPKAGLQQEKDMALKDELQKKKESLNTQQVQEIIEEYEKLRLFQETPDSKENLEKIPLLRREDLCREIQPLNNKECFVDTTLLLHHDLFTNGIAYLRFMFDLGQIPKEYFPYIGILKACLGMMDTKNYKYADLFHEVNLVTGGMVPVTNIYTDQENTDLCKVTFEMKTKVFSDHIKNAVDLMEEILLTTSFKDEKRLYEILAEAKSRMQSQMMSAGHSLAAGRALSYDSVTSAFAEELSGYDFYRLVAQLEEHFEDMKSDLIQKLEILVQMIFRKENLMVDLTGSSDMLESVEKSVKHFKEKLFISAVVKESFLPTTTKKNEGFMYPGQVQYVCRAGNFRKKGLPYTGALRVLRVMLGYGYLWENVRVRGGAYGCMCSFSHTGDSYFVSYRDPHLNSTVEVYEKAADYIECFDADERTLTQFIIGAFSDIDTPLNPQAKGLRSLSAYLTGVNEEMLQEWRNQVMDVTQEKIRGLSSYIRAFMEADQFCVVGNAGKISENAKIFQNTENLL